MGDNVEKIIYKIIIYSPKEEVYQNMIDELGTKAWNIYYDLGGSQENYIFEIVNEGTKLH
ncbi:MAG: hypothetical protein ABI844_04200 [Saprospiraceae bacterium]